MKFEHSHPSDEQLLLEAEGELPPIAAKEVRAHLEGCWRCRARRQGLENAVVDYIHMHDRPTEAALPAAELSRATLQTRLAELSDIPVGRSETGPAQRDAWLTAAAVITLIGFGYFFLHATHAKSIMRRAAMVVSIPNTSLTPGATLLVSQPAVCAQANTKNRAVPVALQRRVFEEYGIAGADPHAYEVDYLVTPALGGADDIHNLWPHSYAATAWNAQVKDALEDRLRDMVCDGSLDLAEAQKEIAADWIAAYKKYFHTEQPLEEHWKQRVQ
jgi:hypothetical protein